MNERDIFHAAMEFTDVAERSAYLEKVCAGNASLKRHVEVMLQVYPQLGTFLEAPAVDVSGAARPPVRAGRFQLGPELARGGMGVIYYARDESLGRDVAVKVLLECYQVDSLVGQRFLNEARITAQLQHPGIPPVFEVGRLADERPYLAMKLIKGRTLEDLLKERPEPASDRGRFLAMFEQICQAVGYAHNKHVLHRDLKPANVMVGAFGEVQVMDWGVAKLLAPGGEVAQAPAAGAETACGSDILTAREKRRSSSSGSLQETACGSVILTARDRDSGTLAGDMLGTPAFMAPEQAGGELDRLDERTDVFGLGAILCAILTGKPPYTGKSWEEVRLMAIRGGLADAQARLDQSGADAKLVALCRQCLAPEREARPRDARAVAATVRDYLASVEDRARQAALERAAAEVRSAEQQKRRRVQRALAAAILMALVGGIVATTWQALRATKAEADAVAEGDQKTRALQQAVTNLYHARVNEAAALRRARGMGYRTQVFNLLQQALQLDTPDKDADRLRNEAVACLGDFVGLEPIAWQDFPADIRKIALTPDGELMAIALENGTIQLRNVSTGGVVAQLSESAVDLGIDPANRCLVTAGAKGTIKVWQDYGKDGGPAAQTMEMRADLAGMARNGRFVVAYSQEKDGGLLSLWDVARQEVKARLKCPSGKPEELLQVSDDGRWVAAAAAREAKLHALVWNTSVPEPKEILFAETNQDTRALSISPDGKVLACRHGDDGLILLDVQEARPRPLIRSGQVLAACFSRDSRFLVYVTYPVGHVRLWDVSRHQQVADLSHPPTLGQREAWLASFSADGNTFATAAQASRSIRIWRLAGSGEKLVLSGHEGGIPAVAFRPDGKILASGSKDRWVKLWDTATGRLLRTLPRFASPIQGIAFSPDGRLVGTGQFGPTSQPVQVWDLETQQAIVPPDDELGQRGYGVAFSPDGKFFAACGNGLTIWRVKEGKKGVRNAPRLSFKRVAHLPGQRSLYLCISSNSKLVAWTDHDFSVCLWDLVTGREVPFLGPPLGSGWGDVAFYPDNDHLTFMTAKMRRETWDTRTTRRVPSLRPGGAVGPRPGGAAAPSAYIAFSPPASSIWTAAWSPDREHQAVGQADGGLAIWNMPKVQAQLAEIGLAFRADPRPLEQQKPQPFVPRAPEETKHQVTQYSNLAKRLAWVGRLAEAEEAFHEALKLMPGDPLAHGNLGKFLADQARYKEAEAEFTEAIQLRPEHSSFWVQRGWTHADRGQWDKASADFVKATECKDPDGDAWYSRAMLHLRDGNIGRYRAICSDMLERFGTRAVWTCTLTPNSGADPARIVSLAEKVLAKSSRDHWHVNQLGAALYRAGRFEEAVKRLTEASELSAGPYRTNRLQTWFFLAMAHHRLGHANEARRWLDNGIEGTKEALKAATKRLGKSGNPDGVIGPNWNRSLTLRLLRREAEELIQGPGTKPEK